MVYWQLLCLSTDNTDDLRYHYRATRLALLQALQEAEFDGDLYDENFCNMALPLLANQRRMYFQMRAIARASSRASGSHVQKTAMLRSTLSGLGGGKRFRDRNAHGNNPKAAVPTMHWSEAASSTASTVKARVSAEEEEDGPVMAVQDSIQWTLTQRRGEVKRDRGGKSDMKGIHDEWHTDEPFLQRYALQRLGLPDAHGVPLPVDPWEGLDGVDPEGSFVTQSALSPVVFCFEVRSSDKETGRVEKAATEGAIEKQSSVSTASGSEGAEKSQPKPDKRLYAMKFGDDLRQDALVLQIFRLMQTTWHEQGLRDITLIPYTVLPLSPKEGLMAFVPKATGISNILQEYEGDIVRFLDTNCKDLELGLQKLVGSTVGYCVATYLLGVGDRHLDNLMMTEEGVFFHIDFGFVLGEDPKPGAPTIRVPREIMDAIKATQHYDRFKHLLGEAYVTIRRTARLWTEMLQFMESAGGCGVRVLQTDAKRGINLVRERLHLELNDEEARAEIVAEVEESLQSMAPVMFDKLHQMNLFWH